ncbi:MAG: PEGA domain-containing protein [Candidatus Doudnabacteria bacterium]
MTLKFRFSLIGFGIILFMFITPVLVLYARGFQFDWHTHKIVKTGAIVIKTDPSGAEVYLSDKKQSDTTPDSIRFLLPGDYNLRIEKDGYQPWAKRLTVREQFVTKAAEDQNLITLFFKDPKPEEPRAASQISLSKTGQEIFYFDGKQNAASINTSNGSLTLQGNKADAKLPSVLPAAIFKWQNAAQFFELLQSRGKWGLTDEQIGKVQEAETTGAHSAAKIGPDLYSLDNTTPGLLAKSITAFTLDGENIWYIQGSDLKRFDYSTNTSETINQIAPLASTARIIRADNQIYAILDNSLYVLNDTFEKIYSPVSMASYDPVSKQMLFGNNNEILIYKPAQKNTVLIQRSSSVIGNPVLNAETGFVFFRNQGKIKAVELDGRDHRNLYTIADDLGNFAISPDGKTLYTFNDKQLKKYTIR